MQTLELNKLRKANGPMARLSRALGPGAVFLREFVKHPAMVGSIIPSSPALVRSVLDSVDWSTVKLFVEYGPGVGTFTRPILDRMRPDATLITIDTNDRFVRYLNADIADYRLRAVHGSAADVERIIADHGFSQADHILSGLPFSTLPAGVGHVIAQATARALRPGGTFLVYQYSAAVVKIMKPFFGRVESGFEWLNVPPCRIFRAYKQEALAQAA
jgi:phospholipid N-methyltransferase